MSNQTGMNSYSNCAENVTTVEEGGGEGYQFAYTDFEVQLFFVHSKIGLSAHDPPPPPPHPRPKPLPKLRIRIPSC